MLGFPDDRSSGRFEEYQWTTYKPKIPLVELLPPSLQVLTFSSNTTRFSDNTEFLLGFMEKVDRLPRLRQFIANTYQSFSCTELSKQMATHGIQFDRTRA